MEQHKHFMENQGKLLHVYMIAYRLLNRSSDPDISTRALFLACKKTKNLSERLNGNIQLVIHGFWQANHTFNEYTTINNGMTSPLIIIRK